jgi:hydroxypyruvate reductase
LVYEQYRQTAIDMIMAGVKAADPTEAVTRNVRVEGDRLEICDLTFSRAAFDRVLLFSVGKASTAMASAFESVLRPDGGLAITKIGSEIDAVGLTSIPVVRGYHPEPRPINVEASQTIIDMVQAIGPDEHVLAVFLVSGGGSALFTAPPSEVGVEDLFTLNQLLMKWGGNIHQINTVRKHVDQVKGGRFAGLCAAKGATLVSLILSDVVGDDLSVVASGPTYPDVTTFADAVGLLKQFGVWEECPASVRAYLESGLRDPGMESLRTLPSTVHNYLIGNNGVAVKAAEEVAARAGFRTMVLTTQNIGEAREVAKTVMAIAKEVQDSGHPIQPPAALIVGGEMTVTFNWDERDGFGPNREFVLSAALEIAGRHGIVVAGADTDGEDGQGKSGAIADCRTISRSGMDARHQLKIHKSEVFFDALGDSLKFESRTNVNDLVVVLVGPKES